MPNAEKLKWLVFIDANQYLELYGIKPKKKLLDLIKEQRNYIFLSAQIVEEVQRNKVRIMAGYLKNAFENSKARSGIPEHLLDTENTAALLEKIRPLSQSVDKLHNALLDAGAQTLERISHSEDEVSVALTELFVRAIKQSPEELERARERKERGNPPGKGNNLGDQLTWEQLLSHCREKSKLWIITKDSDYCTKSGSKIFLNAFLQQELAQLNDPPPEVFCFDSLSEGLRHFVEVTGVTAEKVLTAEESEEIKKQQDSLPPIGWLTVNLNDPAYLLYEGGRKSQFTTYTSALSSILLPPDKIPGWKQE